jgi:pSer/pThr/pTyr-binding forkhead associated (FHA) protein
VAEIAAGVRVGSLVLPGQAAACRSARPVFTIGRLPECDIVVGRPEGSRKHAEIRPAGNGFLLVDLQSTNGTRVNGSVVGEHILVDGDRVGIGATEFRFEAS